MRRRFLYGAGIVLLILSATLVIWEGSFTFGDYTPESAAQTFLYWAVSTLVFLLTVTLAFILFRTAVKLFVERRSNREGSRIKTKFVVGALALSFMPVFFLVLWSISVLNRNLDKWFSGPREGIRTSLIRIIGNGRAEATARANERAAALADSAAARSALAGQKKPLGSYCREHGVLAAAVTDAAGGLVSRCGPSDSTIIWAAKPKPVEVDGRVAIGVA